MHALILNITLQKFSVCACVNTNIFMVNYHCRFYSTRVYCSSDDVNNLEAGSVLSTVGARARVKASDVTGVH